MNVTQQERKTAERVSISQRSGKSTVNMRVVISRYGTIIGLVLLVVFFSITADSFFSLTNLQNLLQAGAVLGVIASGLTVVLILLDFDLSIGYVATAAGMLAAGTAQSRGTLGALVAVILLGVLIGLVNGFVVTKLNVSAFIATLAMGQILQGWLLYYRDGTQISYDLPADFNRLGQGSIGPISYLVVAWVAVMVILFVMLERTVLGRKMVASGGNREAAELSGLRTDRVRIGAFVACSVVAAFAGLMLASNLNAGNTTAGVGYLLPAFAACFIGAATIRDGQFHILGTLVGVLILGVLSNGLVLLGVSPSWTTATQGIVLILAVAISGYFGKVVER